MHRSSRKDYCYLQVSVLVFGLNLSLLVLDYLATDGRAQVSVLTL